MITTLTMRDPYPVVASNYSGQRTLTDHLPPVDAAHSARISRAARENAAREHLTNQTEKQTSTGREPWNDGEPISAQKLKSLVALNNALKNHDLRVRKFLVDQFAIKEDLVGFPHGFAGTLEGYRSPHDLAAFNDAMSAALDTLGISDRSTQLAA